MMRQNKSNIGMLELQSLNEHNGTNSRKVDRLAGEQLWRSCGLSANGLRQGRLKGAHAGIAAQFSLPPEQLRRATLATGRESCLNRNWRRST